MLWSLLAGIWTSSQITSQRKSPYLLESPCCSCADRIASSPSSTALLRYNTVMKIVFLVTSFTICYLMRFHKVIKATYDREQDTFRHYFLVLPCLALAFFLHNDSSPFEVCAWLHWHEGGTCLGCM